MCERMDRVSNMIVCSDCTAFTHRECLGLGRLTYSGGVFRCAECLLWELKIPENSQAQQLADELTHLMSSRVSGSTARSYDTALNRYRKFVTETLGLPIQAALPSLPGQPIPEGMVMLFMAHARKIYSGVTIQMTLSSMGDWHRSRGIDPDSLDWGRIKALSKQIALYEKQSGAYQAMPKAGMSPDLLKLILSHTHELHLQDATAFGMIYCRDEFAFILGFYGLLRRSEIIALKISDITIVDSSEAGTYVKVRIRRSKTDQAGRGAEVIIADVSRHGVKIGARAKRWLSRRSSMGALAESPLLPSWDYDAGKWSCEHLKDGQAFASRLKRYLEAMKAKYGLTIDTKLYAMHSLRRGGVIAAWEAGVPRDLLKIHGRWRSEAVDAYLQAPITLRLKVTRG